MSTRLKKGTSLILLRNLNPQKGLCNGTRVVVVKAGNHTLEVKILGGRYDGDIALIPRIKLTSAAGELPFSLMRLQFPTLNCELYDEERDKLRRNVGAQGMRTSLLLGDKEHYGIY